MQNWNRRVKGRSPATTQYNVQISQEFILVNNIILLGSKQSIARDFHAFCPERVDFPPEDEQEDECCTPFLSIFLCFILVDSLI